MALSHSERNRIAWTKLGVFPNPQFERQRLFSIEDRAGFTLGLAIMIRLDQSAKEMTFQTPPTVRDAAAEIRLGGRLLDPSCCNEREERIG